MEKQKKNIGLYILKILKEYSDEQHPISQTEITKRLKEYGIESIDRGTISNHIDMLNEFGYTIIKKIGGGCYFVNEGLDSSELTFLVDSIFSSPAISQKQAQDLVDRITAESSKYERQRFKNIFKTEELIRTDNRQVFYNIDQINYAIQNNKQISFVYNKYDKTKKLTPRKDVNYVINPYFMVNSKGKYFLVCNKDNYEDMSNYRIDYMTNIQVLESERKPINNVSGFSSGTNPTKYANEHIYMFSGETKKFILKLYSERMINEVIDWFGKDISIKEINGEVFVNLKTNENAIIYWCLQYGQNVEIIEPKEARDNIKQVISTMMKRYED